MNFRKIILVEDSKSDVYLFKYAISKINPHCIIEVIDDGFEAVNYFNSIKSYPESLSLIVLDINLPKVNGIEILKQIRSNPFLENTNVALYSTMNDNSLIQTIYSFGANYYISKSHNIEETIADISGMYAACVGSRN